MSGTEKTTIIFSMLAIVALVFAVTLIVANQKAFAANLCGFCEPGGWIS